MRSARFIFAILCLIAWTHGIGNAAPVDPPKAPPPSERQDKAVNNPARGEARTIPFDRDGKDLENRAASGGSENARTHAGTGKKAGLKNGRSLKPAVATQTKIAAVNRLNAREAKPAKSTGIAAKQQSNLDRPASHQTSSHQRATLPALGGPRLNTRNRGSNPASIGSPVRSAVNCSAVINGSEMKRKP